MGRASSAFVHTISFLPALLLFLVLNTATGIWSYPAKAQSSCRADTLLVMGAAQYHGVPSPVFRRRLDTALELYASGCASKILVTGGKQEGDTYSEGEAGARYLLEHGVPYNAVLAETQSRTSYENLAFSRSLVTDRQVLIVTDDMHAYRSHWLAQHLRIDARVWPVPTQHAWRYGLRELLAVTAYHLGVVR